MRGAAGSMFNLCKAKSAVRAFLGTVGAWLPMGEAWQHHDWNQMCCSVNSFSFLGTGLVLTQILF